MANFVYDTLVPFEEKDDPTPGEPPEGYETTEALLPDEWNRATTALTDLRTVARESTATNVKHYGATGLGVADDAAAIQAAIDAAETGVAVGQSGKTYLPPGDYLISKPLILDKSFAGLQGHHGGNTRIKKTSLGPSVIVGPNFGGLPTATALATGTGSAWNMAPIENQPQWLNVTNEYMQNLNGASAVCFECFWRSTDVPNDFYAISAVNGQRYAGEDEDALFYLLVDGDEFTYGLTTSDGAEEFTTSAANIQANTTYHLAATYDGSNMRLFVNGTAVITQSVTGTLAWPTYMQWILGTQQLTWPEARNVDVGHGSIDSVRISSVARYTSNFTAPTAKLSSDTNTLFLLNFDENTNWYTTGNVGYGGANLKQHVTLREGASVPNAIGGISIDDIAFSGGGIHVHRCERTRLSRLTTLGGGGVWFRGRCALSRVEHCAFETDIAAPFALGFSFASDSGPSYVNDCKIKASGSVAALSVSNSSVVVERTEIENFSGPAAIVGNVAGIFMDVVFNVCRLINDDAVPECVLIFDTNAGGESDEPNIFAQLNNCTLESVSGSPTGPLVKVSGDNGVFIANECNWNQPEGATIPQNIQHLDAGAVSNQAFINGFRKRFPYTLTAWSAKASYVVFTDRGT